MDPQEFLSLLYSVAKDLGERDLKSMKFLVDGIGSMNSARLEKASAIEFIQMLKEQHLITSSDMTFFGELMLEIDRRDLHKKVNVFPILQTSRQIQLPEVKSLMFRMAQSLTNEDLQKACYILNVYDEGYDGIKLMKLIETRENVTSSEKLRQVTDKLGLYHIYNNALIPSRAAADSDTSVGRDWKRKHVVRVLEGKDKAKYAHVTAIALSALGKSSFCDVSGCSEKHCRYRQLWSEKFPHHPSAPLFKSECLLNHSDISADGENTAEVLLGEGGFGKVYKGR